MRSPAIPEFAGFQMRCPRRSQQTTVHGRTTVRLVRLVGSAVGVMLLPAVQLPVRVDRRQQRVKLKVFVASRWR